MIDYVNTLKTSWYISPPWSQIIPPVEVNLLERVYLITTRAFGYCSGVQWKHECWLYTVVCGNEIAHGTSNHWDWTVRISQCAKACFCFGAESNLMCLRGWYKTTADSGGCTGG